MPLGQRDPVLEIQDLSKSYRVGHLRPRRQPAVQGLSLSVERGEIFGFLGPNGSGKTTTLKVLIGLVRPDSGRIQILGHPHEARAWRYAVGYLPEQPYLYDYLTPLEYLDYVGRLFGLAPAVRRDRARMLLEKVGLARAATLPLRRFSKGMTQRVGLAQALMNDPELVLLDEPMSGLDPLGRRLVRDIILDLRERGKTVFFSTHILSDAESALRPRGPAPPGAAFEPGPAGRDPGAGRRDRSRCWCRAFRKRRVARIPDLQNRVRRRRALAVWRWRRARWPQPCSSSRPRADASCRSSPPPVAGGVLRGGDRRRRAARALAR